MKKLALMLLIVAMCLPMTGFSEDDPSEITSAKIVPVRVMNTPLKTEVVKEPAVPRDVNVVNTVDVTASQSLPVSLPPVEEKSFHVWHLGPAYTPAYTVPDGKKFIITDVIAIDSYSSEVRVGIEMVDVILSFRPPEIHLNSGVVINGGQTFSVNVFPYIPESPSSITITGRLVDAE